MSYLAASNTALTNAAPPELAPKLAAIGYTASERGITEAILISQKTGFEGLANLENLAVRDVSVAHLER